MDTINYKNVICPNCNWTNIKEDNFECTRCGVNFNDMLLKNGELKRVGDKPLVAIPVEVEPSEPEETEIEETSSEVSDDEDDVLEEEKPSEENSDQEKEPEEKKPAVPEVVADTKEQKQSLERIKRINKQIQDLEKENVMLKSKAERDEELASTLDYEPFMKLKDIINSDIHGYVDEEKVKEAEASFKDFKSFLSIEKMLGDYKSKASNHRYNIESNEEKISELKKELDDLNEKLTCFQTKII